jgi:subtilisin-like proprotein convertase family protein
MKKQIGLSLLLALSLGFTAGATVFTYNADNIFAVIPDGNLNGYQNSQTLTDVGGYITDVNVTLNISGGWNGDLYAYLYHNNTISILLNRPGRSGASSVGYADPGFGPDASLNQFTLDDQAVHDLHLYRTFPFSLNGTGQLTGQWQPDGRLLDPLSPGSSFPGAPRSNPLGLFSGMEANGDWRLFVADTSSGGQGTLISWGLQITTVPEPAAATLLFCGMVALLRPKPGRARA